MLFMAIFPIHSSCINHPNIPTIINSLRTMDNNSSSSSSAAAAIVKKNNSFKMTSGKLLAILHLLAGQQRQEMTSVGQNHIAFLQRDCDYLNNRCEQFRGGLLFSSIAVHTPNLMLH